MSQISIEGKTLPFAQEAIKRALSENAFSEPARSALSFCADWLGGKERFLLHTSGSTGSPKAFFAERRHMEASARSTLEALHVETSQSALVCLNTAYIAGLMMLVRAMEGLLNAFVLPPSGNPLEAHIEAFGAEKIDFAAMVPLQVQNILDKRKPEELRLLNQIKALIIGGAPLSRGLEQALQGIECPAFATYGMTETLSHVALRSLNGAEASDFFRPLPGVKIELDERGCLVILAPVTDMKPLLTNDLAEIKEDGQFRWSGRADHIINSGGLKINPEKTERISEDFFLGKGFKNAFFSFGLPDKRLGQQQVFCIEQSSENLEEELLEELKKFWAERMPRLEIPKEVFLLPFFERTPTDKINRPATIGRHQAIFSSYAPPSNRS